MRNSTPIAYHSDIRIVSEHGYRGYTDAAANAPYPREYDTWDAGTQRNYEKGRLQAVELRHAGKLKPWRQHTGRKPVPVINAVRDLLADGVVVFPLPKHRQPDAP